MIPGYVHNGHRVEHKGGFNGEVSVKTGSVPDNTTSPQKLLSQDAGLDPYV
jgi:hypothetical protein